MSPFTTASIVFLCVFSSGLIGLYLRPLLPERHRQEESMGMVRLCTGVIATLTALVLGLLVASAKANYDHVDDEVIHTAANVVLLDRTLAQYGPKTSEARSLLSSAVSSALQTVFSEHGHGITEMDSRQRQATSEKLQTELQGLIPENDAQRQLQARALQIAGEIMETRVLAVTEAQSSLPVAFLVVLVLWLSIMFAGFGLVTARNPTVIVALLLCCLSLAGAVFMVQELNRPLEGLMRVSSAPMRYALSQLGM
jgi:hypothetical protein